MFHVEYSIYKKINKNNKQKTKNKKQ